MIIHLDYFLYIHPINQFLDSTAVCIICLAYYEKWSTMASIEKLTSLAFLLIEDDQPQEINFDNVIKELGNESFNSKTLLWHYSPTESGFVKFFHAWLGFIWKGFIYSFCAIF